MLLNKFIACTVFLRSPVRSLSIIAGQGFLQISVDFLLSVARPAFMQNEVNSAPRCPGNKTKSGRFIPVFIPEYKTSYTHCHDVCFLWFVSPKLNSAKKRIVCENFTSPTDFIDTRKTRPYSTCGAAPHCKDNTMMQPSAKIQLTPESNLDF